VNSRPRFALIARTGGSAAHSCRPCCRRGADCLFVAATSAEAAQGKGDYFVIGEIISKPDAAVKLRELILPFAEKSRQELGCKW
jgi:hypothetical protein